jgi:hypothetical protein
MDYIILHTALLQYLFTALFFILTFSIYDISSTLFWHANKLTTRVLIEQLFITIVYSFSITWLDAFGMQLYTCIMIGMVVCFLSDILIYRTLIEKFIIKVR